MNLEEIKARCEAATPGPWVAGKYPAEPDRVRQANWTGCGQPGHNDCGIAQAITADRRACQDVALVRLGHPCEMAEADAAFIAHAREDVPALVAQVERLRAEVAKLESAAEDERMRDGDWETER